MAINKNFVVDAGLDVPTTITVGNTSVRVTINSTSFTGTSNNSTNFAGQPASFYANATNLTTGTLALARLPDSSNVVAAAYGNTTSIPVVTVDSKGRVTGLTTTTIAGISSYSYTAANNTFTILTGAGTSHSANIAPATSTTRGVTLVADSTSNTDATTAASANSVRTTYIYAGNIAATAYANATLYADSKAATAYTNAASYADTASTTAYVSATAFARNANNIDQGTLSASRLSGTYDITSTKVERTVVGTDAADLLYANMADNDQFRIRIGGTATNQGFVEIATADDGTEPIYVRQYTGVFSSLARTATLLGGDGNSSFPGVVTAAQFNGSGAGLTGTASSLLVNWTNVTGRPTNVSSFNNDSGYITSAWFPWSAGTTGWKRSPNGFLMQWGQVYAAQDSYGYATFPITFSTSLVIYVSRFSGIKGNGEGSVAANFNGNGGMYVYNGEDIYSGFHYLAIGY